MNCQELEALLNPYLDGELDAVQAHEVEQHLPGCADCRRQLESLRALHNAMQAPALRYQASDTLKQRLKNALQDEELKPARARWPRWAAAAAAVVLVSGLTWTFWPVSEEDAMADAAIASHAAADAHMQLTAYHSSDPAVLEGWLSHQLPYTPPVQDYAKQGYVLVGARATTVRKLPAAALIYRHGGDLVSVFVCQAPKPGDTELDADDDDGYNVVYWTHGSLSFWVVGKLDKAELKRFGAIVQHAT